MVIFGKPSSVVYIIELSTVLIQQRKLITAYLGRTNFRQVNCHSAQTTRASLLCNLTIPFPRIEIFKCAPIYLSSTQWKNLPEAIKEIRDSGLFKLALKRIGSEPNGLACVPSPSKIEIELFLITNLFLLINTQPA